MWLTRTDWSTSAVADPAAYGLTNVTSPVWTGNYTSASGTLAATTPAAQDQYLFWDQLHPTETGHQAIADAAEQLLLRDSPVSVSERLNRTDGGGRGATLHRGRGRLQQEYI